MEAHDKDVDGIEEGDVGLATGVEQEEEKYVPHEPSKDEMKAAKAVLSEMEKRINSYSPEATIAALIALVDVIDPFRTPEAWPAGEEDEYCHAPVVEAMAKKLLIGCRRLTLSPTDVICLFRNKDKWMDGDRPKRGDTSKFSGRTQYLLEGLKVCVEINYHHWLGLNPLQKVQAVYHELRGRDSTGKSIAPDFVGYFDELELFGVRTFHELVALGHSVALAGEVDHPHQLPLFPEGMEGPPN
jgi:hypothetical protein